MTSKILRIFIVMILQFPGCAVESVNIQSTRSESASESEPSDTTSQPFYFQGSGYSSSGVGYSTTSTGTGSTATSSTGLGGLTSSTASGGGLAQIPKFNPFPEASTPHGWDMLKKAGCIICDRETYDPLRARVVATCKDAGQTSCRTKTRGGAIKCIPNLDYQKIMEKNVACRSARLTFQAYCWLDHPHCEKKPGGHKDAIGQLTTQIFDCMFCDGLNPAPAPDPSPVQVPVIEPVVTEPVTAPVCITPPIEDVIKAGGLTAYLSALGYGACKVMEAGGRICCGAAGVFFGPILVPPTDYYGNPTY